MIHAAMAIAKPGDVIVVDGKGDLNSALIGEIMSQQCVALGIAAVVIDGAVRDSRSDPRTRLPDVCGRHSIRTVRPSSYPDA